MSIKRLHAYFHLKRILITGATSGIGKDLARQLAEWGAALALVARREPILEALKEQCLKSTREVLVFPGDVRDRKVMEAIQKKIERKWSFVDIIIANAGIGTLNPAHRFDCKLDEATMTTNYFGQVNTIMPFLPGMIQRQQGHIVGISSQAAFRGLMYSSSYCASKAAQMVFLESLRVDLKPFGIRTTSIHPGFIDTPMIKMSSYPKPFLVPLRRSTLAILKAIERKKSFYAYPWQTRLFTRCMQWAPRWLLDPIWDRLRDREI